MHFKIGPKHFISADLDQVIKIVSVEMNENDSFATCLPPIITSYDDQIEIIVLRLNL